MAKNRNTAEVSTDSQNNHVVRVLTSIFIESRVSKISVIISLCSSNLFRSSVSDKYGLSSPLDDSRFTWLQLAKVKF